MTTNTILIQGDTVELSGKFTPDELKTIVFEMTGEFAEGLEVEDDYQRPTEGVIL